jgi:hypothetical protein
VTLTKVKQVFALADFSIAPNDAKIETIDFGKGFEEEWIAALTDVQDQWNSNQKTETSTTNWDPTATATRSRIMISGKRGMSQTDIAGIVLQRLESFQVFSLDINAIISDGAYFSPEQTLISRIFEARKTAPCVIYFPDIIGWCKVASDSLKTILISLLDSFPITIPILWLSTLIWDDDSLGLQSDLVSNEMDEKILQLISWFSGGPSAQVANFTFAALKTHVSSQPNVIALTPPTKEERLLFFSQFFSSISSLPQTFFEARKTFFEARNRKLTIAVSAPVPSIESTSLAVSRPSSDVVTSSDNERNENYLREQRLFFWTALSELKREKKFASLVRPVDPEQVADYYDVVTAPMDLETMRSKVDADLYPTFKCFLYDFEQIIFNAKEYNPLNARDIRGRSIVSAAHHILDVVKTHAYAFKERLGYDVFKRCEEFYFRKHGKFPSLNEDRSVMPAENQIYYREIINWHLQLKKEFEEQSKLLPDHKGDTSITESEPPPPPQTRNQKKHETEKSDLDMTRDGLVVSCDEKALRRRARGLKTHQITPTTHEEFSEHAEIENLKTSLTIPAPPLPSVASSAGLTIPSEALT